MEQNFHLSQLIGWIPRNWSTKWNQFKDTPCYLCLAGSVVTFQSATQQVSTLNHLIGCNFFFTEFNEIRETIWRQLYWLLFLPNCVYSISSNIYSCDGAVVFISGKIKPVCSRWSKRLMCTSNWTIRNKKQMCELCYISWSIRCELISHRNVYFVLFFNYSSFCCKFPLIPTQKKLKCPLTRWLVSM